MLLFVPPTRFRPQHLVADIVSAVNVVSGGRKFFERRCNAVCKDSLFLLVSQ